VSAVTGRERSGRQALLDRLPAAERQALLLRGVEGRPIAQVAAMLGVSERRATRLVRAGRSRLRRLMDGSEFRGEELHGFLAAFELATEPAAEVVTRVLESPRVRAAVSDPGPSSRPIAWRLALAAAAAIVLVLALQFGTRDTGERAAPSASGDPAGDQVAASEAPEDAAPLAVETSPPRAETPAPVQEQPEPFPEPQGSRVARSQPPPDTRPAPTPVPAPASETGPLSVALRVDGPERLSITPELALSARGIGSVHGSRSAPRITWSWGELEASLEPGAGVDLVVATEEALVHVVGTRFTVSRDEQGTTVAVSEGVVSVYCREHAVAPTGPSSPVRGGEALHCAPAVEAGYLAWVLALEDSGAAPRLALDVVEVALGGAGPDSDFRGELVWHRVRLLAQMGRERQALEETVSCLADAGGCLGRDQGRSVPLRRLAARLADDLHGCEAALVHLEALPDTARRADDLHLEATCVAPSSPERALGLVERALGLEPTPERRAALEALRQELTSQTGTEG